MKVFIPITDEMIDKGILPDEIVPFRPGQPFLANGEPFPLARGETGPSTAQSSSSVSVEPGPTPRRSAEPALSSSTYMAGPRLG
jgi:hypothetical protein